MFVKYGVRECWLVDRSTQEYVVLSLGTGGLTAPRLAPPGGIAPSDVLPGVRLPRLD